MVLLLGLMHLTIINTNATHSFFSAQQLRAKNLDKPNHSPYILLSSDLSLC